jgi:hypothetical protein
MAATSLAGFPGLQRMCYPEKAIACYRVKIMRRGAVFQQYFPFHKFKSEKAAREEAKRCWKEMTGAFPMMSRRESCQLPRRQSPSGIIGVARLSKVSKGHRYDFWRANFTDQRGQRKVRIFSVKKYGEAEAKKRAVKARENALKQLKR